MSQAASINFLAGTYWGHQRKGLGSKVNTLGLGVFGTFLHSLCVSVKHLPVAVYLLSRMKLDKSSLSVQRQLVFTYLPLEMLFLRFF